MINRELIRQKVVQITYSYYQQGDARPEQAEKELLMSMSKAYELYNYLLLLMVEMNRVAVRIQQMRQSRLTRLGRYETESTKFVDNQFMLQLESNRQLKEFLDNHNRFWSDREEFVRALYMKVEDTDFYKEYMAKPTSTFAEDRDLWRQIYRALICNNDEIDAILDDVGIELRWSGLQSREHCILDLGHRLVKTVCDFLVADGNFHRQCGDTIWSVHDIVLGSLVA